MDIFSRAWAYKEFFRKI